MFKSNLSIDQKKDLIITEDKSIRDALVKINKNLQKCLIVVDRSNKLKGTITDGNIRRGLLKGFTLENNIKKIYAKKNLIFLKEKNFSLLEAKKFLLKNFHKTYIGIIPIINKDKKVIDFFTKDADTSQNYKNKIQKNEIVVMAGGKGVRLKPFTEVLPKPIIPIGNKTAISHIIDNFIKSDFNNFIFSINYKSKLIKAYIQELKYEKNIIANYIQEKQPLGTAGSLSLLKKKIKNDFFVINCDSIIKLDFQNVLNYHKIHNNLITIVVSMKNVEVPYGVCKLKKNGTLNKILEKPKNRYLVNTGLYVVNPKILTLIPKNTNIDFTQLIQLAKVKKFKIGLFPIQDEMWADVGQWSELKKLTIKSNELL